MNDEEFKRKLSEVAEWKVPDTPRETSLNAKKKRGRKSVEEKYQDEHEEIFMELFDGINPTYPPMLTKVKYTPSTCECGKFCANSCKKEAKLYQTQGKNCWRIRCLTCGMTKNPYTGEFNLNTQKASVVWHSFLRETKGTSMSKGNIAKANLPTTKYSESEQDD